MKFHVYDSSLSFLKEKKKGINETSLEIHPMIPSFSKKRILRTKRDDTILRKTTLSLVESNRSDVCIKTTSSFFPGNNAC